jgi:hypothetical protein
MSVTSALDELKKIEGALYFAANNIQRGIDGNALKHIDDARRATIAAHRALIRECEAPTVYPAAPEGAVPVRMIGVQRDGVIVAREDGKPVEFNSNGYDLILRTPTEGSSE